ncbi:hypothetical protein [Natronobacterium texcoconense]|uniref:Uncharacterized protein n=1 Tax=Natronobacterium texcoconense TaxID=1095778 RepID=A0A1H1J4K8_NATTX|nr:hypothetical protein [Natronobacterium texcoconense]SDR44905.1 hypothetical protein SAMN04489842_4128 [Natronobacterium texcoconense]
MTTIFFERGVQLLQEILNVLNQNQGALSVLLSFLLVIAYIAQYRSMEKQREILEEQTKLSHQPLITIDKWYVKDDALFFELSNIGSGATRDIELAISIAPLPENTDTHLDRTINPEEIIWNEVNQIQEQEYMAEYGTEVSHQIIGRGALRAGETGVTVFVPYSTVIACWNPELNDHIFYNGFNSFKETNLDEEEDYYVNTGNDLFKFQVLFRYSNNLSDVVEEKLVWSQKFNIREVDSLMDIVKAENVRDEDPRETIQPQNLRQPSSFYDNNSGGR